MKFIFCADLHLRPDKPRCRIDDNWIETQFKQVEFIFQTCKDKNVFLIIGGDIFNRPQISDYIKTRFIEIICKYDIDVYIYAGNHDLPYHNWENVNNSSFGIIWSIKDNIKNIKSLDKIGKYMHYGEELIGEETGLYFLHKLIFQSRSKMPPNTNAFTAKEILDKYPKAKWIFSGDNHRGFHYEDNGRHLIMAGCINRQHADTKDYDPCIWYVDTDTANVEKIMINDNMDFVDDEYLKNADERDSRIAALLDIIKNSSKVSLDFRENVKIKIMELKTSEDVVNAIEDLMQ